MKQNCASLFLEKRNDAHNEDYDKQEGKHIGHIPTHPILDLRSFSGVGLCQEIFPTPSSFADGKEQEDKGTDGKNEVAHQKILQVQECAGPAHGMDTGQYIEPQSTGEGEDHHQDAVDQASFFSAPAKQVPAASQDILKDRQHRGEGCKRHEDKKQRSPKSASLHVVEHIWQSYKNQLRTSPSLHVIGKACGEDD